MRVEDAHPAIVSKQEFRKVKKLLGSRAPKKVNPRRASSPYLFSGILKCETCGKAMTAAEAKSGKYTYYVCHSLLKRGSGTCKTPRLNAKNFENLIVGEIRENILTDSNIRDLVKLLDEEMDGVAREQRQKLEVAAEEARAMLAERRVMLDSADVIATFAEEMSEFLRASELAESRAFVHSFVKEIEVKPGRAAIVYTIPTPDDSPMGERTLPRWL